MTAPGLLQRSKDILMQADKLFFPPVCLACNNRIDSSFQILCDNCRDMLVTITENYCEKCGGPLQDGKCETCSTTEFYFDLARSAFVYQTPVRELIHHLKYDSLRSPAAFLARAMTGITPNNDPGRYYDYIMAVPLHHVRRRERGYNQSWIIAKKISAELGIPHKKLVYRKNNTRSQTNLSREARLHNLREAFVLYKGAAVAGKRIILVDDVFTTGTTVNEISRLLRDNGAKEIIVMTAARAV
jgi:competence protein ComFC